MGKASLLGLWQLHSSSLRIFFNSDYSVAFGYLDVFFRISRGLTE